MEPTTTTHKSSNNQGECALCGRIVFSDDSEWYCETDELGVPLFTPLLICLRRSACRARQISHLGY